ncbi:SGNH/GDSL hydrolase family protein [Mycobacterium sp. MYCO198283]|uniref:SGNH/GDSL hydrolase family protein n=1 Tax=Mycobacterium sp. MYCO198283 TaxID=2883505 RepID=UPI001E2C549B|nr:SGNH/GDSL hydrolase family protein [Mycobacterium sp. MYCO198283]MCG5431642.1 SGNH/GDSL hydrolase family protein [Mycobacterium sp. MYCO198283]
MTRRRFPGLTHATVLALSLVLVALGVTGWHRVTADRPDAPPVAAPHTPSFPADLAHAADTAPRRTDVLIVGDSFVGGTGTPGVVDYPQLLAEKYGWSVRLDALGGSGYVSRDRNGVHLPGLIERLPAEQANYPVDLLIVDAGRNDLDVDPAETIPRMQEYLRGARQAWPAAAIVVIKPLYVQPTTPPNYPVLSTAIDTTAAEIKASVIDPVAEGWYTDVDLQSLVISDNIHLSAAGNEYYASRVSAGIERAGIVPPATD